jgi:23S rRNA pseudouridine1911/1915/1917 synthase
MREKTNIYRRTFTVPVELSNRRLDYVISLFTDLNRKESKNIIENSLVLVNGRLITFPSKKIKKGDKIIILEIKRESTMPEIEIIYEDDNIIVVNKPSGLLTEKIDAEKGIAVNEILEKSGKKIYPVHRLDRETSGVMIFWKTVKDGDFLFKEFKKRRVNKIYIGVVEGILSQKNGVLKGEIQKTGEYAETHYEVIKILKGATLLKLNPMTGRTHQLRLQLAQIGHPIIGDKKYYNIKRTRIFFPRQALHSHKINFIHPETKIWVVFSTPIPEDMKRLIEDLNR